MAVLEPIYPKFHSLQSWIKILEQSKEIKRKQAGAEKFDNCLCVIFESYYRIFIYRRKTGHSALSHASLTFFNVS